MMYGTPVETVPKSRSKYNIFSVRMSFELWSESRSDDIRAAFVGVRPVDDLAHALVANSLLEVSSRMWRNGRALVFPTACGEEFPRFCVGLHVSATGGNGGPGGVMGVLTTTTFLVHASSMVAIACACCATVTPGAAPAANAPARPVVKTPGTATETTPAIVAGAGGGGAANATGGVIQNATKATSTSGVSTAMPPGPACCAAVNAPAREFASLDSAAMSEADNGAVVAASAVAAYVRYALAHFFPASVASAGYDGCPWKRPLRASDNELPFSGMLLGLQNGSQGERNHAGRDQRCSCRSDATGVSMVIEDLLDERLGCQLL